MTPQDLADLAALPASSAKPGPDMDLADPLTLEDVQVLGMRFDAVTLRLALLLEMRMSMSLSGAGNTGLLLAHGATKARWEGPDRDTSRTAWSIGRAQIDDSGDGVSITLGMDPWPGAELSVRATAAALILGDVPHLTNTPPSYDESDDVVGANLAQWSSEFRIRSVTRVGT